MQNTSQPSLPALILKTLLLVLILTAILVIYSFVQYRNRSADFTGQNDDWQYFPGATITEKGIHFLPLNQIIIHQDGSLGQPNPPINAGGRYLKVKGDFKITVVASDIDKQASFRLYAKLPIVYDQWRYESPSIDITLDTVNHITTARIWDGSASSSMDIRNYETPLRTKNTIVLEHINDQISITVNS